MNAKEKTVASRAYLVESIPIGLEDLSEGRRVRQTGRVLKQLTDRAVDTIDLTAMYWNLKPNPERKDEQGFTMEQLRKEFGAKVGEDLYKALGKAAGRGVKIRIVESPGFDATDNESGDLHQAHPNQVKIRQIDLKEWYDGGIMHQKIWIFDRKNLYIGSANNDWKSLTQVKEMGVTVENNGVAAIAMTRYFEAWWKFCNLKPSTRGGIYDPVVRVKRTVPAWSEIVPAKRRGKNPLDTPELRSKHDWKNPLKFRANGKSANLILAGSPAELCSGSRPEDIYTLVRTIMEAEEKVSVNVMDFAPVSLYRGEWDSKTHGYMIDGKSATPVWWAQLFDAILHVATTKGLHVRMLVSEWEHTSSFVRPYLLALQAAADAGAANTRMTTGKLEIRRFRIQGWESTEAKPGDGTGGDANPRDFPGHTRVNHTKYIVTEKRINVGTSNMTWDYFQGTAGASFNTDHPDLVKALNDVFDRDWNSSYAQSVI